MAAAVLTVDDVAQELQVSKKWVQRQIRVGALRAFRGIGSGYRIRRAWLEEFVAAHELAAEAPRTCGPVVRVRRPPGGAGPRLTPFRSYGEALEGLDLRTPRGSK
jgi:excisionase family DNA binding protein